MLRFVRTHLHSLPFASGSEGGAGCFSEGIFGCDRNPEDVSSLKPAAFTLGLFAAVDAANSHHVQATQNDSRNLINITTEITHRQQ